MPPAILELPAPPAEPAPHPQPQPQPQLDAHGGSSQRATHPATTTACPDGTPPTTPGALKVTGATGNVWSTELRTGTCSDTERIAGEVLPYARPLGGATMDFHLAGPPTEADELVPPALCTATDADGDPRPAGAACDAGADERGA